MSICSNHDIRDDNELLAIAPSSVETLSRARRVARHRVPVLITGESGTGKASLARYIHRHSGESRSAFIRVNCATVQADELDALFMDDTGAHTPRTLFLDQVADLTHDVQAALLRALKANLPGHHIRLIASSRTALLSAVTKGRFRQDLFYRLAVFSLPLVPLRERKPDILPLAAHFIARHSAADAAQKTLSDEARQMLLTSEWPGNLRELDNMMHRGVILCEGTRITPSDLCPEMSRPVKERLRASKPHASMQESSARPAIKRVKLHGRLAEYQYIIDLLKRHNGSKTQTAAFLGITPRALRYRLASMRDEGLNVHDLS